MYAYPCSNQKLVPDQHFLPATQVIINAFKLLFNKYDMTFDNWQNSIVEILLVSLFYLYVTTDGKKI